MESKKKLRGIKLLAAIYEELDDNVRDEDISKEELLEAAQKLIDLSKREYATNTHPDGQSHHGYYSANVAMMMEKFPGRILENESFPSDDDLPSKEIDENLKKLLGGLVWRDGKKI